MPPIRLYYAQGTCSMSCLIALKEAGIPHEAVEVDWESPNTALEDLERLNPQGSVPLLLNEEGKTLTQNAAILETIADRNPQSGLLAPIGTWQRAETLSWLSWVAADLHKAFSPLFALERISKDAEVQKVVRKWAEQNILSQLELANARLAKSSYLMGETFTIADAYLFVVAEWGVEMNLDYSPFSNLTASLRKFRKRASVLESATNSP